MLHGTGGTEDEFIPIAKYLDPLAAIIRPRGRSSENGMPRFFRRLAEGVFDFLPPRTLVDTGTLTNTLTGPVSQRRFIHASLEHSVDSLERRNNAPVEAVHTWPQFYADLP